MTDAKRPSVADEPGRTLSPCQEPRGWCYDPPGLTTYGHRDGCLQHPTWGRHHWHSESDCCVCQDNPCDSVDVRFVLDHERREARVMAAAVDREMDYAMAHGHREPNPFDTPQPCPPGCRLSTSSSPDMLEAVTAALAEHDGYERMEYLYRRQAKDAIEALGRAGCVIAPAGTQTVGNAGESS